MGQILDLGTFPYNLSICTYDKPCPIHMKEKQMALTEANFPLPKHRELEKRQCEVCKETFETYKDTDTKLCQPCYINSLKLYEQKQDWVETTAGSDSYIPEEAYIRREAPKALTAEDVRLIKYFHDKGDITRWVDWEAKKALVEKQYPEVIDALNRLTIAERTLRAVVEAIPEP